MIQRMKKMLLENKTQLIALLESFGYCNFKVYPAYMTFGRDKDSSPKAIVIRLQNNDALIVHDYARNIVCDVFNFVIKERGLEFREVMSKTREVLGETSYEHSSSSQFFGGLFSHRRNNSGSECKPLDRTVLDQYEIGCNERFLKDNISIESQRFFDIRYDTKENLIIIPITRSDGELVGIKARVNRDVSDGDIKYFYPYPCSITSTLFGFDKNYEYLQGAEEVYVFESEKSVMQAYSYGIRNCVALGSSSISVYQARMLMGLMAKRIVLMHDEGLNLQVIKRNCDLLRKTACLREVEICYWKPLPDVPSKASPTDLGKKRFLFSIKNEVKKWNRKLE